MPFPPRPANEHERLRALYAYDVLDTLPEQTLDDLTALAANICHTPISVISLIDEDRQWFKSNLGLSITETPRDVAFCADTITQTNVFVIPDAAQDERFAAYPLACGEDHVRFYAGAPLITSEGYALGALCVMDRVPRELDASQRSALEVLSRQVVGQFELRRKAKEVADSERKLMAVFQGCPVPLAIFRWSDRTFVDINPAYTALLGFTRDEVIGRTGREVGVIAAPVSNQFQTRLAERQGLRDEEVDVYTKEGDLRHILVGAQFIELGREIHYVATLVDDTARHQVAVASRLLTAIVESSDDAIIGKDLNGVITSWNRGAERIFGYTADEMIGTSIMRLIPPSHLGEETRVLEQVSRGEAVSHLETVRCAKNGRLVDISLTASPIRNASGTVIGVSKVARDITTQKRIEMATRTADARYRRLVDSNAQGVMFWNARADITNANDAFLRIVGYTREELEAGEINYSAMTPPEFAELDRRAVEEVVARGICTPYEKEYLRRDGARVHVLVGAAAFQDDSNEGVSFVLDLSERKRLEQQLLRAQRMESIGTLAGGIAHDLNNVLAPILLSIDVLSEMVHDEDAGEFLATLKSSAEHGASLVRQVLSFARGVQGHRIPVNPVHLMNELLKILRDTFPKSIGVQFDAAKDLWTVTGDPTQLHQVLLNLCVNARDAMPSGGQLSVIMENATLDETYGAMNPDARPGAYVVVTVADTGVGMAPEVQDRVFEPFFTTKDVGSGTGLGLATTLAVVKSHSGFIHLYSEPGVGTRFKIYLPANASELAAEQTIAEATRLPRGNGELILVVDDEASIRTIARGTLERFGYRVLLASNGAEAVALFAQHEKEISVVLTDMAMPVMDGPATIVALKAINSNVKVIASSGLVSNTALARAVGAGVQHLIPKPYTAEAILGVLEKILAE